MKELIEIVRNFVADRPVMAENNSDPKRVFELIYAEMRELEEQVLAGDVVKAGREMPDVLWMLISLANTMGVDLDAEFRDKAARNHLKRPAKDWQTGDYSAIDAKNRGEWNDDDYYRDP